MSKGTGGVDLQSFLKSLNEKLKNMEGTGQDDLVKSQVEGFHDAIDTNTSKSSDMDDTDCLDSGLSNGVKKQVSFADMLKDSTPKTTIQISELHNEHGVPGADVAIP